MMRTTFDDAQLILDSPDLTQIIGSKAGAFKEKWLAAILKHAHKADPQSGVITLNRMGIIWWVLFIGPFWLLHRKLYKLALVWFALIAVSMVADEFISPTISNGAMFGVNVAFLLYSGECYFEHCRKLFQQGQALTDPGERALFYARRGGTSPLGWILGLLFFGLAIYGVLDDASDPYQEVMYSALNAITAWI